MEKAWNEKPMTAMYILTECRQSFQEATRLKSMIEALKEEITGITVHQGMGGGAPGDRIGAYMARKDELTRRFQAERCNLKALRKSALLLTANLPALQRHAMKEFYCLGKTAPQIAQDKHYSESSIYKALAAGRKAMQNMAKEELENALPIFDQDE